MVVDITSSTAPGAGRPRARDTITIKNVLHTSCTLPRNQSHTDRAYPISMEQYVSEIGRTDCNVSTDRSRCDLGEDAPIYVQVLGTLIFVVVWPFIVMDIKYFPIGRPAAALVGALLMVVFHVVTQSEVYDIQGTKDKLQTVFLLVGMMMLSFYYDREGILHHIGLLFFGKANRSFKNILWKVCLLSAFLSAMITNDATCLVITPLLLKQFCKQNRQYKELLPLCLGIATSANIGSAATVFGNPQNAFIASSAGVTPPAVLSSVIASCSYWNNNKCMPTLFVLFMHYL